MGTEKDLARGNRDDWKPSNAFWQQSQIAVRTDPRLTGERIEPKTTWLSERQRKRKEKQSKTFQPIPPHLASKEAIEAYVGAMRKPVPTDEAALKLKEEKTPKEKTDEPSTSETQTAPTPAPLFPFNPGVQVASSTLTPGMLSASPEKQFSVTEPSLKGKIAARPNSPVDTFKENLKTNALHQLQQNRIRLDQSQQRFSDPDSKNPNWENLRQQSTVVATLNARERTAKKKLLEIYRNATGDRVSSPFPLLTGAVTSPAERRALVVDFYQHQLGPQWSTLAPQMMPVIDQFYVVDALRAGMFSNEPALAVLTPAAIQAANTPEQRRELHQRMGSEFGDARTSIGNLEWALKDDKDSSVALKFDQTVGQTLAGIKDPQQRQQVVAWVQQQQKAERERERQGTISSAILTVGALASGLLELEVPAMLLGGAGFLSFGKQSIDGMNQAGVNLDAVKAGDAGGQRLSSMSPHQARMDYQMAMVNVGLSLLDAKVAVSSIREVLANRGAVRVLGKLKPNQVDQFAEATQLQQAGKTAEAEKTLQQLKGDLDPKDFKELEKIRIVRQDNDFSAQVNHKGNPKSHIDSGGSVVPANAEGRTSVIEHIYGVNPAKSNSPYTSFMTEKNGVAKVYGSKEIELNTSRLRADIKSGKLKDVKIFTPKEITNSIKLEAEKISPGINLNEGISQGGKGIEKYVKSLGLSKRKTEKMIRLLRAYSDTTRDGEFLIRGTIPKDYYVGPYPAGQIQK